MNSTTSYQTAKQQLINQFNGAEHGIFSLERSIEERPTAARAIITKNGFTIYERSAYISIFGRLSYNKITIRYVIHNQTDTLIFENIF